jgi:hypothetical protein
MHLSHARYFLPLAALALFGASTQTTAGESPNTLTGVVIAPDGTLATNAQVAIAEESGRIEWTGAFHASAPEERSFLFFSKRNGKRSATAKTDSEGRFSIRGLEAGRYNVASTIDHNAPTLKEGLTLVAGANELELRLESRQPRARLSGIILNADETPVPLATVVIGHEDESHLTLMYQSVSISTPSDKTTSWFQDKYSVQRTIRVDETGRFELAGLASGKYTMVAMVGTSGIAVQTIEMPKSGTINKKVVLHAPAHVEGQVSGLPRRMPLYSDIHPEGLPSNVDSMHMQLSGGSFRKGPLPQADRWLLDLQTNVDDQGYTALLRKMPIKVSPGERHSMLVELDKGLTFDGRVTGPDSEALSGVSVVAESLEDSAWAFGAITDKNGKYSIRGMPDGRYKLTAMRHAKRTAPG